MLTRKRCYENELLYKTRDLDQLTRKKTLLQEEIERVCQMFNFLFFYAIKITTQHAMDMKIRESQFQTDLVAQLTQLKHEKNAIILDFVFNLL